MSLLRLHLLPSELLLRIFKELDTIDVLNAGLTCARLHAFSRDDTVWRSLCTRYRYWSPHTNYHKTSLDRLRRRRLLDTAMDDLINRLIAGPGVILLDRLLHEYNLLFEDDMEAKERLYSHFNTPDSAPDALARRYWASAVMTLLNRRQALILWSQLSSTHVPLEQAVASIDMFVRQDGLVDFNTISNDLDDLATEFVLKYDPRGLSIRDMALLLAHFLVVDKGFCTNPETSVYYKPMCSLISLSLEQPGSFGMPLTYVCLYCFLADRLGGLDAQPLTLPGHAFVMIQSPPDVDLDGNKSLDSTSQIMYVDLWRGEDFEAGEEYLRLLLTEARVTLSDHNEYLRTPSTTLDVMRRIRRNISAGYEMLYLHGEPHAFDYGGWPLELRYASWCLTAFIMEPEPGAIPLFASRVPYLTLSAHSTKHPWDLSILQRYLPPAVGQPVLNTLYNRIMKELEDRPQNPRTPFVTKRVRHRVGTLFRHRRYLYVGFIIGWSVPRPVDKGQKLEKDPPSFYNIM